MVAFKDFIQEASDLRPAEINKYAGRPDDRIPVFLNKVSQGAKFATTDGKEVIIDKSEVERLKEELETEFQDNLHIYCISAAKKEGTQQLMRDIGEFMEIPDE